MEAEKKKSTLITMGFVALVVAGIVIFAFMQNGVTRTVVTSNIIYSDSFVGPQEVSFSIFNSDGTLLKTMAVPSDLMTGMGNNIKVFGQKIYYMSGSQLLTSVGEIDVATGQSKVLGFTQTTHTSPGNGLFAIVDWSVSSDNTQIAWMDTTGIIKVANVDGSNLRSYNTGLQSPTLSNQLEFVGDNVYFELPSNTSFSDEIRQINLANGSITTVAVEDPNSPYEVSLSNKYIVYVQSLDLALPLAVKNLATKQVCYLPLPLGDMDFVSNLSFSPDESKVMVALAQAMGGSDEVTLTAYTNNCQQISILQGYGGLDFLTNSKLLTTKQEDHTGDLYLIDVNGGAPTKFSSGFYKGILVN